MISILYEKQLIDVVAEIVVAVEKAFLGNIQIELLEIGGVLAWPAPPSWDDLLLAVFDGAGLSLDGNDFIKDFLLERGKSALLLPVAVDLTSTRPPKAAEHIKAIPYDDSSKGNDGRLVKRIGGMLGLRVQGRESKIFISYRAKDGKLAATQIFEHLQSLGHSPWRDEAVELDGYTSILPGSEVQAQINEKLNAASLVLLLDTPMAPDSAWIRHEVDTADSMLIPILPICFRDARENKKGPRFRSLLLLQRWVDMDSSKLDEALPLSKIQLDLIVLELETYLCEIFRRKCRVPFIVEKEFLHYGFDWIIKDKPLFMFGSTKIGGRLRTSVTSHCSIFDQIYKPSMSRFKKYLNQTGKSNYSLFIYDGDLLPEEELVDMLDENKNDVVVLHHQELSSLISSNFTNLGTP